MIRNGRRFQKGNIMIKPQIWICGLFLLSLPNGLFQGKEPFPFPQLVKSAPLTSIAFNKYQNEISLDEKVFEISLADIGMPTMPVLNGPYGEAALSFNIPGDWELTKPVVLELRTNSEFYSFLEAFTEGTTATEMGGFGSSLEITLNGQTIERVPVNQAGESLFTFEIPASAFSGADQPQALIIGWDSALACQNSTAALLKIDPDSKISFTYRTIQYSPELTDYPAPFFIDNNILPNTTTFILPPNPSEQELSALLTVSAGLGNLTDGELNHELVTTEKIKSSDLSASHLVLIGKFDSLDASLIDHALMIEIGEILNSIDQNSGLVYMDFSPWNPGRAMLIVTGRSDGAVIKAGTALGAAGILPYSGSQYAVIKDIKSLTSDSQYQIDQPLLTLGNQELVSFDKLGESAAVIPFIVPADISINPEAFLELNFRHSQLLDYLRSTIEVSINGIAIGNIRFNDQSNENGVVRFIIPPNVIKPLLNVLTIKAQLAAQDVCGDSRSGDYWARIFGDSYLHLPPVIEGQNIGRNSQLSDFPLPFISDPHLRKSIFVLDQKDYFSLKKASEIAFTFGVQAHSDLFAPSAKYAGSFTPDNKMGNYIVIGFTDSIPFSAGINDKLPLKFEPDGNWEEFDQPGISFAIDQAQDLGYVEYLPSAENDGNIITILGNTQKGLDNAVELILSASSNDKLRSMNVAAITNGGLVNGFLYLPEPLIEDEEVVKKGLWNLIQNPEYYPIVLLIIVLVIIAGLILWPVVTRKRSEKE